MGKPVQLMFPQVEGYRAAVPSKHDLRSFIRSIHAELAPALGSGGDFTLSPLLTREMVKGVKLLCASAERVLLVTEASHSFAPGQDSTWSRNADQEHNHQLLVLCSGLRDMLGQLKAPMEKAAAAAGEMQHVKQCRQQSLGHLAEACTAVETFCGEQIVAPILGGMCHALEAILASMHKENFGAGAVGAESGSSFAATFQQAINAVHVSHLAPMKALGVPSVAECSRKLATRLLRSFVSHAALVRPLEEAGKLRMAGDLTTLEMAIQPLAEPEHLGEAYRELRAFRQLLFVEGGDVTSVLAEQCTKEVRPSVVWHHLLSTAPSGLSLPHAFMGISEAGYVEWLLGGAARRAARERCGDTLVLLGPLHADVSREAEEAAGEVVEGSIDGFLQRCSATNKAVPATVMDLRAAVPKLLALYEPSE
ncbi:unnamed protein product [Chrysoparadoxa australica]